MDTIKRAAWSLAKAIEMMHAAKSKRPDWLLDLWRLAYTKGDWDDTSERSARTGGSDERTGERVGAGGIQQRGERSA